MLLRRGFSYFGRVFYYFMGIFYYFILTFYYLINGFYYFITNFYYFVITFYYFGLYAFSGLSSIYRKIDIIGFQSLRILSSLRIALSVFFVSRLISFGFTSHSNEASKNNDMLSNKNLNTNIPSLCFSKEVLFILLDFKDNLAYFNSF